MAGYKEILKVLLNDFRKIKVDQKSKAGFTALMKAAIQGRTACAKLILFAGMYLFCLHMLHASALLT